MQPATPSQTVGPFFHDALAYAGSDHVVPIDDPSAIRIEGRVLDGAGDAVPDALLETWQASRSGRYAHPEDSRREQPLEAGFSGFGRVATDEQGHFALVTVKPGAVPAPGGAMQAPHIDVSVFARGLLRRLVTRIYFPDERDANAADPVLGSIEDARERATLIAREQGGSLCFDVHLQGADQTAFFSI